MLPIAELLPEADGNTQESFDRREKRSIEVIQNAQKEYRRALIQRKVPADFRQPFDRSNQEVDWQSIDRVMAWDGKQSIFAKGISGLGKTRAIYALLQNELIKNGRNWLRLNEAQILTKISDAAREYELDQLRREWLAADILWFDDLDKVDFKRGVTGSNAETIVFGTIKARAESFKTTFICTNLALLESFQGQHTYESLKRRIGRDKWLIAHFKKPTK